MSTAFEKIVRQAVELTAELNAAQQDLKMNAGDIVKKCLELGKSSPEQLTALRWQLDSNPEVLRSCIAYIRGIVRLFSEGKINASAPSSLARMNYAGFLEARRELGELKDKFSMWDCWAIAAQQGAVKYPEQFGSVTDAEAHQAHIDELKDKLNALLANIPHAWGAEDIVLGPPDREGKCLVTLKVNGVNTGVTLSPVENLGSRLIDHLTSVEPLNVSSAPAPNVAGRKAHDGAAAPL